MTKPQPKIVDNVRAALALRNITHGEAAKRLRFTSRTMTNKMTGRTDFYAKELLTISDMTGVPIQGLFNGFTN